MASALGAIKATRPDRGRMTAPPAKDS